MSRASVANLKILQEVITLSVFVPFAGFYLREPIELDCLACGRVSDRAGSPSMRTWLLLTFLTGASVACANAQDPGAAPAPAAAEPIVVADGRTFGEPPNVAAWSARAPVQQAMSAARAHWQAHDPEYEEEAQVFGVVEGSFSGSGADQEAVLYLMSLWPRCCPKMGIAVIEDGALARNIGFEAPADRLTVLPDLDGDGRDELAIVGSFGMGGENSTSVTVVSLADSGLRTWGGAMIQYDSCAAMQPGGTAARITAASGPAFSIENYELVSCDTREYRLASGPEPLELTPPEEETSVELPVR